MILDRHVANGKCPAEETYIMFLWGEEVVVAYVEAMSPSGGGSRVRVLAATDPTVFGGGGYGYNIDFRRWDWIDVRKKWIDESVTSV